MNWGAEFRCKLTDALNVKLVLGQEKITSGFGGFSVSNKLIVFPKKNIIKGKKRNDQSDIDSREERCEKGWE
jgi:hypothetical protein